MRILGSVLVALVIALVPSSAQATFDDYPGQKFDRWDVTYTLNPDGSMDVRLEADFNFGNTPGRGPYWTLNTRVGYDDEGEYDRLYNVSNVRASSPTGAPAKVYLDQGDNVLSVRVGDENIANVMGVQTYVVEYRVDAVMNSISAADLGSSGDQVVFDEFYWNVTGLGGVAPISNVSVTVIADPEVLDVACFSGRSESDAPCDDASITSDGHAQFFHGSLFPGEGVAVAVAYQPGHFDTEPNLIVSNDFKRAFALTPVTVGGSLVLLGFGLFRWMRALRTKARDDQFAGLTPGLAPAANQEGMVTRRDFSAPVTVHYQPPPGLRPGQLGTLLDEKADTRDVTATMVDLAVRGYLRVDDAGQTGTFLRKEQDYTLVKLRDADGAMVEYEKTLFNALFLGRNEVKFSDLKTTFASSMASVQSQLYANVTTLGWFKRSPNTARAAWAGIGIALISFGGFSTAWLASTTSLALVTVPFFIIGLLYLVTTSKAPARTAEGTRVLAETQGFERFLETADANQLRFEEGHDIFSEYLPFAIAFGVADRWAKKFEELAAQGRAVAEPTWFSGGYAAGAFWSQSSNFGSQMNQFASLADAAISAPTPGSSGGSGFSGGGGSSGGGGGGGGSGGW